MFVEVIVVLLWPFKFPKTTSSSVCQLDDERVTPSACACPAQLRSEEFQAHPAMTQRNITGALPSWGALVSLHLESRYRSKSFNTQLLIVPYSAEAKVIKLCHLLYTAWTKARQFRLVNRAHWWRLFMFKRRRLRTWLINLVSVPLRRVVFGIRPHKFKRSLWVAPTDLLVKISIIFRAELVVTGAAKFIAVIQRFFFFKV